MSARVERLPSLAVLVPWQARFSLRAFLRNPAAVFFSVLLPVLFLVLLSAIFGNQRLPGRGISVATYYVPGVAVLGIVSTTFMNLAIQTVVRRERGVLKRLRGTPLPPLAYVLGEVAASCLLALLMVAVVIAVGGLLFGVAVPGTPLTAVAIGTVVGAASFSALGLALAAAIPNEQSAPAVANAMALPLYFVSGLFFDVDRAPAWLVTVAEIFPLKHLLEVFLRAFGPGATGVPLALGHLAVVVAWGAFGVVLAARSFRWTPRGRD